MSRHAHAFSCSECQWWNSPMLRDDMHGNYILKCGHCNHAHHRYIKNGVVSETRHHDAANVVDVIHVLPSACTKEKPVIGAITRMRAMQAGGLMNGSNDA